MIVNVFTNSYQNISQSPLIYKLHAQISYDSTTEASRFVTSHAASHFKSDKSSGTSTAK